MVFLFLFCVKIHFLSIRKGKKRDMKKKLILTVSIMSLFLSGCNPVLSMKDTANGLKGKVVKKFTSASKALDKKLDKRIATINKAIADKDEEIIYDQMSDDLKKDGDKLRTQLKEFVNFVPGEITEVTDRSYGILSHSEKYDKSPDGYYGVTTYRISYNAIDDQNFEYVITIEFIKENKANPGEIGLNYVNIYKFDSDEKEYGFMEVGSTLV